MQNPNHFQNPRKFLPDRFLSDEGVFVNDVRVCVFSLGFRNCVGKQLAIEQYFRFAVDIIQNFRIEKAAGHSWDLADHSVILMPDDNFRISFIPRNQ